MATETIDQAAVEQFVAAAPTMTPEQLITVAARLEAMVRRGERAKGAAGYVSLATMTEAANRLRALATPVVAETPAITPAPAAAPVATPAGFTRIKITGRNFDKAVSYAKRVGGKYDPTSRTWLIPSSSNYLAGAGSYGWTIIERN